RPGLRRLRPLPLVRLRLDGRDWPAGHPLLAAARLRADVTLPAWRGDGRLGARRLPITVAQAPASTLARDYEDPDGRPAHRRDLVVAGLARSKLVDLLKMPLLLASAPAPAAGVSTMDGRRRPDAEPADSGRPDTEHPDTEHPDAEPAEGGRADAELDCVAS